jgi:hypothetical protein
MIFAPFAYRQGRAVAISGGGTATLQYELFTNGITVGTFSIYKNGSLYQTLTTDTSLITITLTAGDTFYSTLQNTDAFTPGGSIDYFVNGSFVTTYSIFTTATLTTPTVTSVSSNTYKYTANFGAV